MDDMNDIARLPVNSEQHRLIPSDQMKKNIFEDAEGNGSQCTKNKSCKPGMTGDDELCLYCMYTHKLDLPHLPDMVFPCNVLQLTHDSGCCIEFNALDSLFRVSNGKMVIKIASSAAWTESRTESGHTESVVKPFDWTFSTDYQGTLKGNWLVQPTSIKIDINKLKQREKILFYNDLTLFEDELHDNGIALLSVKIRVMPSSFFILLRYFLRVDNVLIKINDTRLYHEFETDYVIREYTAREAKVDELKVPHSLFMDPNEICLHLPLIKELNHKLMLPSDDTSKKATDQIDSDETVNAL